MHVHDPVLHMLRPLINPRLRMCGRNKMSVHMSIILLENAGSSEHETWTCYQVGGIELKIRLWSGEARGSWRNGRLPQ